MTKDTCIIRLATYLYIHTVTPTHHGTLEYHYLQAYLY